MKKFGRLLSFMLVMATILALPQVALADVAKWGSSGSGNNPLTILGFAYEDQNNGGKRTMLTSNAANTVLKAQDENGKSILYSFWYAQDKATRLPYNKEFIVLYENGVKKDITANIADAEEREPDENNPVFAEHDDMHRVRISDLELKPGSVYEFRVLRGIRANNGMTGVIAADNSGYLKFDFTDEEQAYYDGHKHDVYRSLTNLADLRSGEATVPVFEDFLFRFKTDGTLPEDPKDPDPVKQGWAQENGKWVLFENGNKLTGWQLVKGKWYYMDAKGDMLTGWQKIKGIWYMLDSKNGDMKTGWVQDNGKWYYMSKSGAMATGWAQVNGKWYYLDKASGEMKTGWIKDGKSWYFLDKTSGAMLASKWLNDGGKWYYLDKTGAMMTGKYQIGSKTYTFNSNGVLV